MSKPVRIRGDVAAQVDERAQFERRSFANMVEVLLLEALHHSERSFPEGRPPVVLEAQSLKGAGLSEALDRAFSEGSVKRGAHDVPMVRPHFRKDRPAVQCSEKVAAGSTCSTCGAVL